MELVLIRSPGNVRDEAETWRVHHSNSAASGNLFRVPGSMNSMAHGASAKHPGTELHEATPSTVPKVRLYVERPEKQDKWFVNVGRVTDRGRWRTEPHAHPGYGQVIFVRNGRGVMNLEGRKIGRASCRERV